METSIYNKNYQQTVQQWLLQEHEILVLFSYPNSGGAREYRFFSDYEEWRSSLSDLLPGTYVNVWYGSELPLRGSVDAAFIEQSLKIITDEQDYLIVVMEKVTYGKKSWYPWRSDRSHAHLKEDLEDFVGQMVALGKWPERQPTTVSKIWAVVPAPDGSFPDAAY